MLEEPVPLSPTSSESDASRASLNELLLEVLIGIQRNCRHAKVFQTVVPLEEVADYHQYVDPEDATACLEQILSRTQHGAYTSVRAFRREFEQLLANALAYNTPGNGRLAYKPIIAWAQELLETCCFELEAHRDALSAAVKRAKGVHQHAYQQEWLRRNNQDVTSPCPTSSLEALLAVCEMMSQKEDLQQHQQSCDMDHAAAESDDKQVVPKPAAHGDHSSETTTTEPMTSSHRAGDQEPVSSSPRHHDDQLATSDPAGPRHCRLKTKVFIKPNKVIYLPSKFMEDNFDPASLPCTCKAIVEADGVQQAERHLVTIKAVPRQGRSTMYCMANVMPFQQQYINWQVVLWSKVDDHLITIHLQPPSEGDKDKLGKAAEPHHPIKPTAASKKRKSDEEGHASIRHGQSVSPSHACSLPKPPAPGSATCNGHQQQQQPQQLLHSPSHGSKITSSSHFVVPSGSALVLPGAGCSKGQQLPVSSSGASGLGLRTASSSAASLPQLQQQQQYQAALQQGSLFQATSPASFLPQAAQQYQQAAGVAHHQAPCPRPQGAGAGAASPACPSGMPTLNQQQQQQLAFQQCLPYPSTYQFQIPPLLRLQQYQPMVLPQQQQQPFQTVYTHHTRHAPLQPQASIDSPTSIGSALPLPHQAAQLQFQAPLFPQAYQQYAFPAACQFQVPHWERPIPPAFAAPAGGTFVLPTHSGLPWPLS